MYNIRAFYPHTMKKQLTRESFPAAMSIHIFTSNYKTFMKGEHPNTLHLNASLCKQTNTRAAAMHY